MNEIEKRRIKAATEDVLTKKYKDEVGQKAVVQRETVSGEHVNQLNEVLQDIGRDMKEVGQVPDEMPYLGSCAVHIYASPVMGIMAFRVQNALDKTPMNIANSAVVELSNTIGQFYTGKRKKLRSGL